MNPDFDKILTEITTVLGMPRSQIKKHDRHQEFVACRAIFYHLAWEMGYSQQETCDYIGHCRVTVHHGVKLIKTDRFYRNAYQKFMDLKAVKK